MTKREAGYTRPEVASNRTQFIKRMVEFADVTSCRFTWSTILPITADTTLSSIAGHLGNALERNTFEHGRDRLEVGRNDDMEVEQLRREIQHGTIKHEKRV